MNDFMEILKLSPAGIKKVASRRAGGTRYDLCTALVLRKYMEKYNITDLVSALDQFLLFKKAQAELLSLSDSEKGALTSSIDRMISQSK